MRTSTSVGLRRIQRDALDRDRGADFTKNGCRDFIILGTSTRRVAGPAANPAVTRQSIGWLSSLASRNAASIDVKTIVNSMVTTVVSRTSWMRQI